MIETGWLLPTVHNIQIKKQLLPNVKEIFQMPDKFKCQKRLILVFWNPPVKNREQKTSQWLFYEN